MIRLLPPARTFATGTLNLAGVGSAGETITIGSITYTLRAAPTTVAYEVKIGASASDTCDNLIAAINAGAGSGTLYGSATVAHPNVTAAAGSGDTVVVTLKSDQDSYEGPAGIGIATTETLATALSAWAATTLTGAGTSAANSAPSAATDGVALPHMTDRALLFLTSILGSGTMAVTGKLWGYSNALAKWFPLGTNATAANKGLINGGNAMGETSSDGIRHCEEITSLRKIDRVYLELSSFGGTGTEIAAYLDCVRASAGSEG
jgi:hypothetical protein